MTKTVSLLSALLCTFIWGTTFIAQDTGMDDIGPFTFNAVRFFVGFLAVAPLAFIFERKKNLKWEKKNKQTFIHLVIYLFSLIRGPGAPRASGCPRAPGAPGAPGPRI